MRHPATATRATRDARTRVASSADDPAGRWRWELKSLPLDVLVVWEGRRHGACDPIAEEDSKVPLTTCSFLKLAAADGTKCTLVCEVSHPVNCGHPSAQTFSSSFHPIKIILAMLEANPPSTHTFSLFPVPSCLAAVKGETSHLYMDVSQKMGGASRGEFGSLFPHVRFKLTDKNISKLRSLRHHHMLSHAR